MKMAKTADGRHVGKYFGHNSAADCPISVKFRVMKQYVSHRMSATGEIGLHAFHRKYFLLS